MTGRDAVTLSLLGIVVLTVGGTLLVLGWGWIPWSDWGGRGMMGWPMMGYGMMFGTFLIPLLFLVLLVAGAYYAFRPASGPSTQERGRALEIVKERYAKGEITKEQYEQLRKDLE